METDVFGLRFNNSSWSTGGRPSTMNINDGDRVSTTYVRQPTVDLPSHVDVGTTDVDVATFTDQTESPFQYVFADELLSFHNWYLNYHGYLASVVCIFGIIANIINIAVLTRCGIWFIVLLLFLPLKRS